MIQLNAARGPVCVGFADRLSFASGLAAMGVMPFTVRAESANAVATLRCRSAQDALLTAHVYLRLGAALDLPPKKWTGLSCF
ncbi:hypothetical protein [Bradyrhizobium sp.]|uniref:hypothetical protein n=1 Tax=Bradyrhizobium sp. TaxID=376 RepID=UPI003918D38D